MALPRYCSELVMFASSQVVLLTVDDLVWNKNLHDWFIFYEWFDEVTTSIIKKPIIDSPNDCWCCH